MAIEKNRHRIWMLAPNLDRGPQVLTLVDGPEEQEEPIPIDDGPIEGSDLEGIIHQMQTMGMAITDDAL